MSSGTADDSQYDAYVSDVNRILIRRSRHLSRDRLDRYWRRPTIALLAACVLALGLTTAASSSDGAVVFQAQQTRWHVNDEPVFFGSWTSGDPVESGKGYGSSRYHGSNYAYSAATSGKNPAGSRAVWHMGDRVGNQEIQVFIPGNHATARAKYRVITRTDSNNFSFSYSNWIEQADLFGWHQLGNDWETNGYWDTNGGRIEIEVQYDESKHATGRSGAVWRSLGADAVRMRCVSNCEVPVEVPDVPSNVRYSSGWAMWNAVSGAFSYDVAMWDGSTETIAELQCCKHLLSSRVTHFRVRAGTRTANGDWSDWVEVPVALPGVPSGVRVSSGEVTWRSVSEATSYDIEWTLSDGAGVVSILSVGCCSFSISDVHAESFRVRAVNDAGRSDWSDWVDVPVALPGVPSNVRFSSGRVTWNSVTGATSYNVNLCISSSNRCVLFSHIGCCSIWISDENFTHVRIQAVNNAGTGGWSRDLQIRDPARQPGVPSNVRFSSGRVTWNSVTGATSYNVNLCVSSSNGCIIYSEVECCSFRISDETVTHVRIQAVNNAGTGEWSRDLQIRDPARQPGVPSGVQVNSGSAVWGSVSGATSYTVRLWDGREARNVDGVACCRYSIPSGITQFNVRAVNAAGAGPWSGWVSIVERPGTVSNVQSDSGRAVWSWLSGATSYTVRLWDGREGRNVDGIACCTYSIPSGITFFNVRAVNGAGAGPWSGWERAAEVPDPVRNLRFLAQGWHSSDSSDRRIVTSWTPPLDDGGSNIIGYTVTISRPGRIFGPYRLSATKRSYTLSNPRSDTTYKVRVVARNRIGSSQADRRSLTTPERSSNSTTTTPTLKCPTGKKFETVGGKRWLFLSSSTRIQALQDFKTIDNHQVKIGDLGGIVSGEHNLEQSGCAWIHYHAVVKGKAKVEDNAVVGKPSVGESSIGLEVSGSAMIFGHARVYGANTRVFDSAKVFGYAHVYGGASVSDSAQISGDIEFVGGEISSGTFNGITEYITAYGEIYRSMYRAVFHLLNDCKQNNKSPDEVHKQVKTFTDGNLGQIEEAIVIRCIQIELIGKVILSSLPDWTSLIPGNVATGINALRTLNDLAKIADELPTDPTLTISKAFQKLDQLYNDIYGMTLCGGDCHTDLKRIRGGSYV